MFTNVDSVEGGGGGVCGVRARSCGCLSLRFGALLAALVTILYSVLALAQCLAEEWGTVDTGHAGGEGGGGWRARGVLVVAVLAVNMALSALLLVGVLREKAWLLVPWVWWRALQLAAAAAGLLAGGAAGDGGLLLLLADFLAILINFYMLTVVASYWRELVDRERDDETARLKPERDARYTCL